MQLPPPHEIYDDQPPNLFACAALAVKNTPLILTHDLRPPAPVNPLLWSFVIHAPTLPPDIEEAQENLKRVAMATVIPHLPAGYTIAQINVSPVSPALMMKATAQLCSELPLMDRPEGVGSRFFAEAAGEAIFFTFRPGMRSSEKSQRYAILCPYCGLAAVRFDRRYDVRTPDGLRVAVDLDVNNRDPVQEINDIPPGAEWKGYAGVLFGATCGRGHTFDIRLVEDETSENGPSVFVVFEFKEPPRVWIEPTMLGSSEFPPRVKSQ